MRSGERLTRIGDELDAILTADLDTTLAWLAIGGTDHRVKLFSMASGELAFEMDKHTDWVTSVEFSPDGRLLATADRAGGLVLWEATTGREYAVPAGHKGPITAVSWRRDSKALATSSEDGSVRIWDPEKVKPVRSWTAHPGGVTCVQFAVDGSLVTGGRDRRVTHWDANGKVKKAFPPLKDIVLSVCITCDGQRIFAGDWLGHVTGWQANSDEPCAALVANPATLEERLAEARAQVAETTQHIASHGEARAAAEAKMQRQWQSWVAEVAEFAAMQAKMAAAAQDIAELSSSLQVPQPAAYQVERSASLRQTLNEVTSAGSRLQDQVAATLDQWQLARAEFDKQTAAWEQETAFLATSQRRVDRLAKELEQFATVGERLQRDVSATETEVADLNRRLVKQKQRMEAVTVARESREETPRGEAIEFAASSATDEEGGTSADDLANLEQQLLDAENVAAAARERWKFFQAAYGGS